MVSPHGIYICNGGQPRKIGDAGTLDRHYQDFSTMLENYIRILTLLRRVQEQLSAYIQSFGGDGTIHGTIADIDFENHIMINTEDGSLTSCYSPVMGTVMPYPDISSLIREPCPRLIERFAAIGSSQDTALVSGIKDSSSGYERVDIRNSPYAVSRRVNAPQRLFDRKTLRQIIIPFHHETYNYHNM